jgi:hypothetical protein
MKITNRQISIFLILLIGINIITSSSLSIKSNKRSLSKRRTNEPTSKEAADTLLTKLKTEVTKPSKIAFFSMGILSNWFPKMDGLYREVKEIKHFFKPCYEFIKVSWEMIKGKSVETDPAKKVEHDEEQGKIQSEIAGETIKVEELENKDLTEGEDKKKFCTKAKELIEKIWLKAVDYMFEEKSNNEKSAYVGGSHSIGPDRYCRFPLLPDCKKAHKLIAKHFDSQEDFYDMCVKFRETTDCDQFAPDNTGAWHYIKKTLKYGLFMKNGAVCIFHLLKAGGKDDATNTPEKPEIATLANTAIGTWAATKSIFKELGALILHIFSFGIWGVLRAAWNILKLALKIFLLVKNLIFDIPYNLGKLVGLCIKIIKSFLLGRRRRK